jgi:glucose-6-phosphate isomerase
VFSAVGLLPAALAGIDLYKLCGGAAEATERCLSADISGNPALMFAGIQHAHYSAGRKISVMMPYFDSFFRAADWFRQLWAESLGKEKNRKGETVNAGPTPVAALGATDQHSQVQLYREGPDDKIFTFLLLKKFRRDAPIPDAFPNAAEDYGYLAGKTFGGLIDAEGRATTAAIIGAGRPSIVIELEAMSPRNMGYLMQTFMIAAACAGELFDVNAFNQPGVQLGKDLTYSLMGKKGFEGIADKYSIPTDAGYLM